MSMFDDMKLQYFTDAEAPMKTKREKEWSQVRDSLLSLTV